MRWDKPGKYKPRGQHIPFVRGFRVGAHWVTRDSKPKPGPRRLLRAFRKQMAE